MADIVGGCIREVMYDMNGPAFLKKKLLGFGVDRYQ
jgi:hypothetical protein